MGLNTLFIDPVALTGGCPVAALFNVSNLNVEISSQIGSGVARMPSFSISCSPTPGRSSLLRRIAAGLAALSVSLAICLSPQSAAFAGKSVLAASTRLGPTAASTPITLSLVLPVRNQAQLTALIHKLYNVNDSMYGQYLTPARFTAEFGPTSDQVTAVKAAASRVGLAVLDVSPNNTIIRVGGAASTVDAAFGVTLNDYIGPDGGRFIAADRAPTLPAGLAGSLLSVVGLDGSEKLHHAGAPAERVSGTGLDIPNIRPTPSVVGYYSGSAGLLPSDVYSIYDWTSPSTGAGQSVALVEFAGWTPADITDWGSIAFHTPPTVTPVVVPVDGETQPILSVGGSMCCTVDIDLVLTMAPGISNLYVYEPPANDAQDALDMYNQMASDDKASMISSAWGYTEDDFVKGEGYVVSVEQAFEEMAAQGQTFCEAAGDNGAYADPYLSTPNVGFEAAMPYVLSVGGTDLTDGPGETYVSETSWGLGTLGGGGGFSSFWALPSFQIGAFNPSVNTQGSLTMRNLPDVSIFSDYGDQGYEVLWTDTTGAYGPVGTQYTWWFNGNEAPLWAGFLASVNAGRSAAFKPGIGFANPAIYSLAERPANYANDFHDIADGSNNLFYNAVTGYDNSTGWGTFVADNLYADLVSFTAVTVQSLSFDPSTVGIGESSTGTVTLSSAAPVAGATVEIVDPTNLPVASAVVNSGDTTGTFTVIPPCTTTYTAAYDASTANGTVFTPIPAIPAGVTATGGAGDVALAWSPNTGGTSYSIYRSTTSGDEGPLAIGTATGPSYTDTDVSYGVWYYYTVVAIAAGGTSPQSSEASATPIPAVPTGLSATAGNTEVSLAWSETAGAASYNVYRATASGGEGSIPIATCSTTAFIDSGLTNGVRYFYTVTAVNTGTMSAQSSEVSATPEPPAPPPPLVPAGLTATAGNRVVSLSWTASSNATSYDVYRATTSGGEGTTVEGTATGTVYNDIVLPNVTYYYTVAAVNSLETSSQSSEASAIDMSTSGTVWAWGFNGGGDFGNGTTTSSTTPVDVGLNGVTAIACNSGDSIFLESNSTVWESGMNDDGELGNGTTSATDVPVEVTGLTDMTAIAQTFGVFSLALRSDGTVWAWGANNYGQLGNGNTTDNSAPVEVTGVSDATAVAGGGFFSMAGLSDGTVEAWGENNEGQLGNGSTTNSSVPVDVTGLTGVTAIAAGGFFGMALRADGTVWSWGENTYGELGNGTFTSSSVPVEVTGLTGVTAIAGGGDDFGLALESNGTVWAWGNNGDGELGNGSTTNSSVPVQVTGIGAVVAISAGIGHSLAIGSDGSIRTWGDNLDGDLGNGTSTASDVPVEVTGLSGVSALAGGDANSLAILGAPVTPTGLTATGGNGQVLLSWTAGAGATSYNIYQSTASGGEGTVPVATSTSTSLEVPFLTNGDTYYFKVASVNSVGTSAQSSEASATPEAPSPPAPTGLTATAGDSLVSLSWVAAMGATSYNVYRSTISGGEGTSAIGSTSGTGTTYSDTGLTNGVKYFYTVATVNGAGTSSQSSEVSATPENAIPATPTGLVVTGGNTQVALAWTASSGSTSYNVYRGTASGGEGSTAVGTSGTSTSYVDIGLTNGVTYFYKVAAVSAAGTSAQSSEVSVVPDPLPVPTNLTATAGDTQVSLSWSATSVATSYNVYRGSASGAEGAKAIGTSASTSYTDFFLSDGVTYYYKVAAVNSAGTSAQSSEASATPEPPIPVIPTGLTATPGNAQVALTWTVSTGATTYNVYRATASGAEGSTAAATGITAASYTDTGLTNGVTYFFKVAAVNGGGTSAQSTEASATPEPPIPAAPTGLTATGGMVSGSPSRRRWREPREADRGRRPARSS